MTVSDDKRQKVFSEEKDPETEYRLALLELFRNPPKFDQLGREWGSTDNGSIWNQISEYINDKHPGLDERLKSAKTFNWFEMVRPMLERLLNFSEKDSAREIWPKNHAADFMQQKTVEICLEKGCSFSEAFSQACLENPGMTNAYYEEIHGR